MPPARISVAADGVPTIERCDPKFFCAGANIRMLKDADPDRAPHDLRRGGEAGRPRPWSV
jgi:hypothetical protein